jgi:hypothetical protein
MKFENLNKRKDQKEVYTHFTCATDTSNIQVRLTPPTKKIKMFGEDQNVKKQSTYIHGFKVSQKMRDEPLCYSKPYLKP